MDYIDLNGKLVQQTTSQDKLLDDLYRHMLGRLLLKPLVTPAVSRLARHFAVIPFFHPADPTLYRIQQH